MFRKKSGLLLIVCLVFMAGHLLAQSNKDELMKKVEGWNKTFCKAMVNGDDKTILSVYADDAYSLPSYSPMMVGKKAIEEGMEMDKKSGTVFKSFNLKTKDVWTSGDILCEVGTYTFSMLVPNSKNTVDDYGKYLTIYQKQKDGSWKIKADMWNTDTNPWAMMQEQKSR